MKTLSSAFAELLREAEQEDRDELAGLVSCYGDPDLNIFPVDFCLAKPDVVRRLADLAGLGDAVKIVDRKDGAVMHVVNAEGMKNLVSLFRAQNAFGAMVDKGLDAVAAIPPPTETPPDATATAPLCEALAPSSIFSATMERFDRARAQMDPSDENAVAVAMSWCATGHSILPPIWALERIGLALLEPEATPVTAIWKPRGCLTRHLRRGERVPGMNILLSRPPHDLYYAPPTGDDASNPLMGYLYSLPQAAEPLLPQASSMLALDTCPVFLPEGKALDTAKELVENQNEVWRRLLRRLSAALGMSVSSTVRRTPRLGIEASMLRLAEVPPTSRAKSTGETKTLESFGAPAILAAFMIRPSDHPEGRLFVDPPSLSYSAPRPALATQPTLSPDDAWKIWFAATHLCDLNDVPPSPPTWDDDANAVMDVNADQKTWDGHTPARAFYLSLLSLLFASGTVETKYAAKARPGAKHARRGAIITSADAKACVLEPEDSDDGGPQPAPITLSLRVVTNIDAAIFLRSLPQNGQYVETAAKVLFARAFVCGETDVDNMISDALIVTPDAVARGRIGRLPECSGAVVSSVGTEVVGAIVDNQDRAFSESTWDGEVVNIANGLRARLDHDPYGRLTVTVATHPDNSFGDIVASMLAASYGRPFLTERLIGLANAACDRFAPSGDDKCDMANYLHVSARIGPERLRAVGPLVTTCSAGGLGVSIERKCYMEPGAVMLVAGATGIGDVLMD